MPNYVGWINTVLTMLEVSDEDACLALLQCTVSATGETVIALVEGDVSAREALAYARCMLELGNEQAAEELVGQVIQAELTAMAA
jgi:hypothetical protein